MSRVETWGWKGEIHLRVCCLSSLAATKSALLLPCGFQGKTAALFPSSETGLLLSHTSVLR